MELESRIKRIQSELQEAAQKWGRAPKLIAVTKTVSPERINELIPCGIGRIGENRAQELLKKMPYLDASFQIDMIGRLQINKVKSIIDKVSMIQSLDRLELAEEIDRRAQQHELRMPVLVEVNIAGESQKGGIAPEEVAEFVKKIAAFPGLQVRGLMSVMPNLTDKEDLTPFFKQMRMLYERIRDENINHTRIDELSMGMSGDYQIAAREGATHVRVGTALFGSRVSAQAGESR